ncbi:MAG: pyrimidine 5'-nucleotidase [Anaerolineales bacterium]|nr:pyrimidine 5'-nucleotidase [Anaerolineales bacterium]
MRPYDIILFDLDDTLYTPSSGLWEAISERIYSYMQHVLSIPIEQIHTLRKAYLDQYGTTLAGLMDNGVVDPHDYLDYVHDVSLHTYIEPNPSLSHMLQSLPQKKIVFTNASEGHARRVLDRLGIASHFAAVIGVETLKFINKPQPEAFQRVLKLLHDPDPSTCIMVEDRAVNLKPAHDFGMGTVLVDSDASLPWIDHRINNILELAFLLKPTPAQTD